MDLIIYPNEVHHIDQPKHRYEMYERNVDWFRFSLESEEDHEPAKVVNISAGISFATCRQNQMLPSSLTKRRTNSALRRGVPNRLPACSGPWERGRGAQIKDAPVRTTRQLVRLHCHFVRIAMVIRDHELGFRSP